MTMAACWLVFPLVLTALSVGCGLLVETLAGIRLPGTILPPLGLAVIIVVASFATMASATAKLATPAVVALALAGFGLTAPWQGRRVDWWAIAAAIGVFAVYAAPIVLSGGATFAGYITLDDTSTWLAMTDRVMEHGRSLSGLQPSTYEATLDSYLKQSGYPVGSFLPLGVGAKLVGKDIAWLFQPYIAYAAAMLALSLYTLLRRLITLPWLRAICAFTAAQAALLYGYAMWSGIKEVTAGSLIGLFAALLAPAFIDSSRLEQRSLRSLLPLAIAVAAVLAALSVGGIAWLLPAFVIAVLAARIDIGALARRTVALGILVAALSVPAIVVASAFIRHETSASSLTGANELGNLFHRLSWLQIFGIWPTGDFRGRPTHKHLEATYLLIGVVVLAATAGLWWAWRRRAWGPLLYVSTLLIGAALLIIKGSPWVDGKAMATASPALLLAATAGCALMYEHGRRIEAAVIGFAILGGVLWSNVLDYHQVWLAPRAQLTELEAIGKRFPGSGPTLMTEYQSYGARHFLRSMDPEGASELRRRIVPLLSGQPLASKGYADLDEFNLNGILVYKTLVLRRSPAESRPSSVYHLVERGKFYDVWQRPSSYPVVREHLPLGDAFQPGAIPRCKDVLRLGRRAGQSRTLAAAPRSPAVVATLASAAHPANWLTDSAGLVYPRGSGALETNMTVAQNGRYSIWLGGSFRDRVLLYMDGQQVANAHDYLNGGPHYTPMGSVNLNAGTHHVTLRYSGPDFHPGSAGFQFGLGPLVLSRNVDDVPVEYVPASEASSLCGKYLDWIEVVSS